MSEPLFPPTRHTLGSNLETPPAQAGDLPEQFGRYRIVKKLGQGGMGAVYLAHDTELDRSVALKVPRFASGDSDTIERFKREARTAATLQHANLCPVFDVGEIDGRHYLTMGYVEGRSLAELIAGGQSLPERPVADLVRKLALALEEAHRKGVVHRDLKPANIMITEGHEPVILDFGLARQVHKDDVRLTAPGMILGTPAYMPPEQVRGDTAAMGPACDIYSLGVVLYELLTGQLPFHGPNLGALIGQVLIETPPAPSTHRPGVDRALESICQKAMAKDPAQRYSSMAEFAAALGAYLNGQPAPAHPGLMGSTAQLPVAGTTPSGTGLATQLIEQLMARLEASEARAKRRPLWPWLASGAAAVLAGILVWLVIFRPEPVVRPIIVIHITIQKPDPGVRFVLIGETRVPIDELDKPVRVPAGAYTIKLEHEDGRTVDVGEVALGKDDDNKAIEVKPDNTVAVVARAEPPPKPDRKVDPVQEPGKDSELKPPPDPVQGTNIAIVARGIVLVDAPGQYDNTRWAAANLVAPSGQGEFAAPGSTPIAVVVGFPAGRLARVEALGVNPTSTEDKRNWVREVEFEVSDTYPFTGFRKIGTLKVEPVPNDAILRLEKPITARYVRFTFLRNGGGGWMELNKVLVMGKLVREGETPLPLVNVALAKNGGKVKQFSSEYDSSWKADFLIDGNPGSGWSSKSGEVQSTITIELGRPGVVRHIVINPYSPEHLENSIREAEVLLSETGKAEDFRSIGKLSMEGIGRDHSLDLKSPTKARFVKFSFLKNGGGGYMQAHEVKVFAETESSDLEARCAALFEKDAAVRQKAAEALQKSGDRRAVPFLVQRVADDEPNSIGHSDKSAALEALRALAPEKVGEALIECCRANTSAQIRAWSAHNLVKYKSGLSAPDREQAVELLGKRVADDRANSIGYSDKSAALETLHALAPEKVGEALIECCRANTSAQLRVWAAHALVKHKSDLSARDREQAVELLAGRVADDRANSVGYSDKSAALETLKALEPARTGKALVEAWRKNQSHNIRVWAAERLAAEVKHLAAEERKQAIELLAERVGDNQGNDVGYGDKTAALKTLRLLDAERAKAALERAKRSTNPIVVKWAERS